MDVAAAPCQLQSLAAPFSSVPSCASSSPAPYSCLAGWPKWKRGGMLSCKGWTFQGIKRQLIVFSRKLNIDLQFVAVDFQRDAAVGGILWDKVFSKLWVDA